MENKKYPIGGFAPGYYHCKCLVCAERFQGDKRATMCEPCAIKLAARPKEVEQPVQQEPKYEAYFNEPCIEGWYPVDISRIKDLKYGIENGLIREVVQPSTPIVSEGKEREEKVNNSKDMRKKITIELSEKSAEYLCKVMSELDLPHKEEITESDALNEILETNAIYEEYEGQNVCEFIEEKYKHYSSIANGK